MSFIDLVREPVRTIGFIRALAAFVAIVALRFGIDLTGLEEPFMEVVLTGLALLGIAYVGNEAQRARVTPVADPVLPAGTLVTTPDGESAIVDPLAV